MRFLYCRMFCIGARETAAKEVSRAQMTQVARAIEVDGATVAACRGPAADAKSKQEMIKNELAAPFEQVEQTRLALSPSKNTVLVDSDHRQTTALRGQSVMCPGSRPFL
jgi:DNA transposition AAA+ family ATPase